MTAVISIFALSVAAMLLLVFFKPALHVGHVAVSIFWVAPVGGVLLLLLCGKLTPAEIVAGLSAPGAVNPLQILVLFFSMTLLSVFLDEAGFFRYLAGRIMQYAGTGQMKLFVSLYLAVSVLTVFTSNDIIVLTFTPFICYFAKNAEIDPLPYLFCEFVAANTWSMLLIIGKQRHWLCRIYRRNAFAHSFCGRRFLFGAVAAVSSQACSTNGGQGARCAAHG